MNLRISEGAILQIVLGSNIELMYAGHLQTKELFCILYVTAHLSVRVVGYADRVEVFIRRLCLVRAPVSLLRFGRLKDRQYLEFLSFVFKASSLVCKA